MTNGQNGQNCVKSSFSTKSTKICEEKQGQNVLHVRGNDVTHAGFKTLSIHNFMRTD